MFLRPISYFANRFHWHQTNCWLAYKAGMNLFLDCGRRSGKSELFAELLIEDMEDYQRDAMFIAITRIEAREILWPKLEERLKNKPRWHSNESRLEWIYKGNKRNSTLHLKGADKGAKALRGGGKHLILCDEFAFWDHPEIIEGELIPQLADYNGQLGMASTPKGKNHFFDWRKKIKGLPDRWYHGHWTMFDNPYIPEEGRAKIIASYSGKDDPYYRQEILSEYVDFAGMVFAIPEESYTERQWDPADLDFSYHWRGMDHGFSPDPTACVWMAYNKQKGHYQIYDEYEEKALLVHQHKDAIVNRHDTRSFIQTVSDIDPQLIAEYDHIGLDLTPAGKYDKESRLVRLVTALRSGRLKISTNCVKLLAQMKQYEWGQDGDDHLIDALLYIYTNHIMPEPPEKKKLSVYSHFKESEHTQDFGD